MAGEESVGMTWLVRGSVGECGGDMTGEGECEGDMTGGVSVNW